MDISTAPRSVLSTEPAETIFAVGTSGGANSAQLSAQTAISAHKREINRIRGYKLQLTPPEEQQLARLQEKIVKLNQKAALGTIRSDEIRARSEYFREADRIIGKPSVDVESDPLLSALSDRIDALLEPKLDPATAKRVEVIEKIKAKLEERLYRKPKNAAVIGQLRGINRLLEELKPPRAIRELSVTEQRSYNDLVRQVNEHAQAKLLLDARESIRVNELQRSINRLSEQVPVERPSPLTAARAASVYARFG